LRSDNQSMRHKAEENTTYMYVFDSRTCYYFLLMPNSLSNCDTKTRDQEYKSYREALFSLGEDFFLHADRAPALALVVCCPPREDPMASHRHHCTQEWLISLIEQ
jgi:hypothetical protein